MKLGYLYGGKVKGSVNLGIDPYTGLPSTLRAPGGLQGPIGLTVGNIYYVNGTSGNNSNDGLTPTTPLLTIFAALAKCVDNHDDYIIVIECWQQETFPINVSKSRVHILGVGHMGGMAPAMQPPTDTAIFTITTKGYIEIAYFNLGSGATHAAIEFLSTTLEARSWIHDVWFGHSYAGQDGIKTAVGENPEITIEYCIFGKLLTRDGIRIEGASTRTIIRYNIFRLVPGVGINVVAINTDLGAIIGNKFSLTPAAAAGSAITIGAGAVGCLCDDNHAMEAGGATTQNPYVDGGACDWGVNWRGDVVGYPV